MNRHPVSSTSIDGGARRSATGGSGKKVPWFSSFRDLSGVGQSLFDSWTAWSDVLLLDCQTTSSILVWAIDVPQSPGMLAGVFLLGANLAISERAAATSHLINQRGTTAAVELPQTRRKYLICNDQWLNDSHIKSHWCCFATASYLARMPGAPERLISGTLSSPGQRRATIMLAGWLHKIPEPSILSPVTV